MKYLGKHINLVIVSILFFLGGCSTEEDEGIIGTGIKGLASRIEFEGVAQKGPFVLGSSVTVNVLSSVGDPTTEAIVTETLNDLGTFNFTLAPSRLIQIMIEGFHFNEITGRLSAAPITLRSIYVTFTEKTSNLSVNVMTHLIHNRVLSLIKRGVTGNDAIQQAETELINALKDILLIDQLANFSTLTLFDENGAHSDGNAYLLALSSIAYQYATTRSELQGESVDAVLTLLLNTLSDDLAGNGRIDNSKLIDDLLAASRQVNPAQITENLLKRSEEVTGNPLVVANMDKFIDSDGDGIVNENDNDDDNDGTPDANDPTPYGNVGYTGSSDGKMFASAGVDRTLATGTQVFLDGSTSRHLEAKELNFTWAFVSKPLNSKAILSDATTATPSFTTDQAGAYVVRLNISDGNDEAEDTITIVANDSPVVHVGDDRSVGVGALVIMDGSKSNDHEGDSLTYTWSFATKPSGSTASLTNETTLYPSFTPDVFGIYTLTLTIHDGISSSSDTVNITANTTPTVEAGTDRSVSVNSLVELDGSNSSDSDDNTLSYHWVLTSKPEGSIATINAPTDAKPTFTPDVLGAYIVTLTVDDGFVQLSDSITLLATSPQAMAGADQTISLYALATLDASESQDPEGDTLTYQWSLISKPEGSVAALDDASKIAPKFTPDLLGNYIFSLTINDGFSSSVDTITLTASSPIANAGQTITTSAGTQVTLDGSGSSDLENDPLTYQWSILSKPESSTAILSDPTIQKPTFTPDVFGNYFISLTVNDGFSDSDATVNIKVEIAWKQVTPSTTHWSERAHHTSVVYDDKLWVLGGGDPNNSITVPNNDVWSSADGTIWEQITASASWSGRYGHGSVVFDGKMWVLGGYGGFGGSGSQFDYYNDVWSSTDGFTWNQMTANAQWEARENFTTLVFDNKIWVLGGCVANGSQCSQSPQDVWYSEDGINWTQTGASDFWSAGYPSAVLGNTMWVLATVVGEQKIRFSNNGETWTSVPVPWKARTFHSSVVFGNNIWVMGGKTIQEGRINDVWYSSDGTNWSESVGTWLSRSGHTSVVFNNQIWILGGVTSDAQNTSLNDIWHSQ